MYMCMYTCVQGFGCGSECPTVRAQLPPCGGVYTCTGVGLRARERAWVCNKWL